MRRLAFGLLVLGGCFTNPTIEVDKDSVELARGTTTDLLVSVDGVPVTDLSEIIWTVDDGYLVSVTKSYDGYHLRVGGNYEGETVVRVYSHGQEAAVPTRVGPPTVLLIWTEPETITATVGSQIQVKAKTLDTIARIQDVTFDSRWNVRDDSVASLDQAGMMLTAMEEGQTTLHVNHGATSTVVPVAVFK